MQPRKAVFLLAMALWLGACAATAITFLRHETAWTDGEVYMVHFLALSALTFPIGPVVVTVGEFMLVGIGVDPGAVDDKLTVGIMWSVMVLSGFFQWFVMVPWTIRRFRRPHPP